MADLNLFFWPVSHFFTKWYNIAQSTFPAFNSNVNETYSTYSTEVYQQHCFSFFCSVAFFPLQPLGGKSFIFHHILSLAETLILSPIWCWYICVHSRYEANMCSETIVFNFCPVCWLLTMPQYSNSEMSTTRFMN